MSEGLRLKLLWVHHLEVLCQRTLFALGNYLGVVDKVFLNLIYKIAYFVNMIVFVLVCGACAKMTSSSEKPWGIFVCCKFSHHWESVFWKSRTLYGAMLSNIRGFRVADAHTEVVIIGILQREWGLGPRWLIFTKTARLVILCRSIRKCNGLIFQAMFFG